MKKFNFTDKNQIASLVQQIKDINAKYPLFITFLENYCGYNNALLSADPYEICYSQGKRDVILTLKTLTRDDIQPEVISDFFKKL